jgi:hypothetical protein
MALNAERPVRVSGGNYSARALAGGFQGQSGRWPQLDAIVSVRPEPAGRTNRLTPKRLDPKRSSDYREHKCQNHREVWLATPGNIMEK